MCQSAGASNENKNQSENIYIIFNPRPFQFKSDKKPRKEWKHYQPEAVLSKD
jgi:hypothetical protein